MKSIGKYLLGILIRIPMGLQILAIAAPVIPIGLYLLALAYLGGVVGYSYQEMYALPTGQNAGWALLFIISAFTWGVIGIPALIGGLIFIGIPVGILAIAGIKPDDSLPWVWKIEAIALVAFSIPGTIWYLVYVFLGEKVLPKTESSKTL